MKPVTKSKLLLLLALLVAGLLLPAAETLAAVNRNPGRGVPQGGSRTSRFLRRSARPNNADDAYIESINNYYLELTPGYLRAGKAQGMDTFYGASIALGRYITQEDKLQLELGFYRANSVSGPLSYKQDYLYNGYNANTGIPLQGISYTMNYNGFKRAKSNGLVTLMLSYSYLIPLGSRERFAIRLTPAAGLIYMPRTIWSVEATGLYVEANQNRIIQADTVPGDFPAEVSLDGRSITKHVTYANMADTNKMTFGGGGGIGLTWSVATNWYLDAGYRFLWLARAMSRHPADTTWSGMDTWNSMNLHCYTLTLGWNF